jgi:hypothetical protein
MVMNQFLLRQHRRKMMVSPRPVAVAGAEAAVEAQEEASGGAIVAASVVVREASEAVLVVIEVCLVSTGVHTES